MGRRKKIRQNALVVFDENSCSKEDYEQYFKNTFPKGELFVFLGEIPNNTEHCILHDFRTGKIIGLYHIWNFREATEDEC